VRNPEGWPASFEQNGIHRLTVYCRSEQKSDGYQSALHHRLHDQKSPFELCLARLICFEVSGSMPPGRWRAFVTYSAL
jgi:hypothetical protein